MRYNGPGCGLALGSVPTTKCIYSTTLAALCKPLYSQSCTIVAAVRAVSAINLPINEFRWFLLWPRSRCSIRTIERINYRNLPNIITPPPQSDCKKNSRRSNRARSLSRKTCIVSTRVEQTNFIRLTSSPEVELGRWRFLLLNKDILLNHQSIDSNL